MSLEAGELTQVTDIVAAAAAGTPAPAAGAGGGRGGRGGRGDQAAPAAAGEAARGTDSQEYLKKEQKDLFEVIRERAARQQEDEDKRKKDNPRKPLTLQARQSVVSLQLTPDEKLITAEISENGNAKTTIIPNFVTESAYTEDIRGRSDVGDTPNTWRLAVIAVDTGEVKWVDTGIQTAAGKPRQIELAQPIWSDDGSGLSSATPPITRTAGSSRSTRPPRNCACSWTCTTTPG